MMMWSDDPIRDADRWMKEQENRLALLPHCCCCGEPIVQEKAICIDGDWYCIECELDAWDAIRDNFLERVETE